MMVRTQIQLGAEQHRKAKLKAAELGISLSEYLRRLIDGDVGAEPKRKFDITRIFGIGDSGGSDVAKYKEQYLDEAMEADYRRWHDDRAK